MALFNRKKSAWDRIRSAVAEAAELAGERAEDWWEAAADAGGRLHERVSDGADHLREGLGHGWDAVQEGVHTGADAAAAGARAVGRGVAAVDHKVESVANGVVAGVIAGAIASWVMNQYQAADAAMKSPGTPQATGAQTEAARSGGTSKGAAKAADGSGENATVQVAEQVSREVFGHELKSSEKAAGGAAVHYGYGAIMGGLYGGLAELVPAVGAGLGVPYATALWLFGDEIATSALGLGKPPKETTASEHATAFASHLVYGVTLDVARRVLRHIV